MIANLQKGDKVRVQITSPNGDIFSDTTTEPMEKHKARYVSFAGKKRTVAWEFGVYKGLAEVINETGKVIARARIGMTIKP